jgi:RIO kinase 1
MQSESKGDFDLRKFVPEEEARKTFAKVFDRRTIQAIHRLATRGYFELVEHVISTGKEAHVFQAVDKGGNARAVKVYKTGTSDFNKMHIYIHGDRRFGNVRGNKRDMVFAWTQKEFKNLLLINKAGIACPMPLAFFENVLVMEFIGKDGKAAPTLREAPAEDIKAAYKELVGFLARMLFKAELVHADFSEYNILNNSGKLVLIDAGQAVLTSHPEAEPFFERDLKNVAAYFSKHGLEKTAEQVRLDVRALKKGFSKRPLCGP